MTKLAEEPKAAAELDAVRKLILDRSAEMRLSLTDLSRAAGRNDAYVHQFIWRGSPKRLPEAERAAIAAALQVPAAALRLEYSPRSGDAGKAALPPPVFPPYRPATQPDHGDIPVYVEGGPFDPDKTAEWTPRPGTMAGGNGLAAVWVARDHGRVRAGDMLYVRETQPPRPGDVVVVVRAGVIVAIGNLDGMDASGATIDGATYPTDEARILKVAAVKFA